MAELLTIKLSDIHVPERLRELDRANAMFIADSVKRQGLMHPITVRRTPAKKGAKFTLVAGRHRMEAIFLNELDEIDAFIVKTDETGARLKEIEENLFRNDLSQLDRAIFVTEFRRLWEAEHGEIKRGGSQTDKLSVWSMSEVGGSFVQAAAERLGIHSRSIERLQRRMDEKPWKIRGSEAEQQTPVAVNINGVMRLLLSNNSKASSLFQNAILQYLANNSRVQKLAIDAVQAANEPSAKKSRDINADDVKQWMIWRDEGKSHREIAQLAGGVSRGIISMYTREKTMPKKIKRALGIPID